MFNYLILVLYASLFCNLGFAQSNTSKHIPDCRDADIPYGNKIIYEITTSSNGFLIYGVIDSVLSEKKMLMRYFHIWDCKSRKEVGNKFLCHDVKNTIFECCLPSKSKVEKTDSTLSIIYFGVLPVGNHWEIMEVPTYTQELLFEGDSIYQKSGKVLIDKKLSQEQEKEVMDDYRKLKKHKSIDDLDTDSVATTILKLYLCSLNGNTDCKRIFLNIERYLPGSTQGLLGDIYGRWLGIYYLSKQE